MVWVSMPPSDRPRCRWWFVPADGRPAHFQGVTGDDEKGHDMTTDSTAAKIRKRDTGEKGNRGEFATVTRSEAEVNVAHQAGPPADPMAGRASLEGVAYKDQPKAIATVTTYHDGGGSQGEDTTGRQTVDVTDWLYDHPEEVSRLEKDYELPLAGLDGADLDNFRDEASGDGAVEDDALDIPRGDGGTDLELSGAYAEYVQECRAQGVVPFSDHAGHEERQQERYCRKLRESRRTAIDAVDDYAEQTRTPRQTTAQARARAAHMVYRDAAEAEAREAIDKLRELGARNGATYVSFPPDDDIDDSSLLSAHPVFWDADGNAMEWNEEPEIENGQEYAAWQFSDRDEVIVSDLAPSLREDPDLDAMSDRIDHAFIYRCTPKGA